MIHKTTIKNYLPFPFSTKAVAFTLIFNCTFLFSLAQVEKEDEQVEKKIENLAVTADENTDFSEIAEALTYYKSHPIDLNNATRDELLESGLMNEMLVNALMDHIAASGKLITLEELQTIDEFDDATIENLLPYVKVNTESP